MGKNKLIIVIIAFVILLAGAGMLYNQLSGQFAPDSIVEDNSQGDVNGEGQSGETGDEPQKQMAPDFTVYDAEGNPASLSDFFGKPIVLNFWASWCGPCKSEMPDFEAKYKELGDEIQFLMVNCTGGRETLDSAKSFVADSGYTFPVYYDTDLDASYTYGTSSIPQTFFIDKDGYLTAYAQGAIGGELLMQGIGMIAE